MNREWINRTHVGDCRELLAGMISDRVQVQTCVTSPPYYGLRDYGTGKWEGGDNPDCDHARVLGGTANSTLDRYDNGLCRETIDEKVTAYGRAAFLAECGKCGASRVDRQIGLSATSDEYVGQLVTVFRLVREVLADDGTLWLNIGDSYASGGSVVGQHRGQRADRDQGSTGFERPATGGKAKNLLGIPWRVAFALQADGWYLRSDIIWHKPNPMPESVTDRPTKAHEYLFLLAKSERYYYDAASIAEDMALSSFERCEYPRYQNAKNNATVNYGNPKTDAAARRRSVDSGRRNRRTVWTVATTPFSGAHFACFPRALIEPCIIAGARPGDVVLDPFMGSGTTGQVATDLGRHFIGCELNREYVELVLDHRKTTQGMPW